MLRGKVEGEISLLSEGSSVKESPSRPLPLVSGEVPRFHGGSLWHSTQVTLRTVRLCGFPQKDVLVLNNFMVG